MSFVYAINEEEFVIMSDSKITINDRLQKLWNDYESRRIVEQFGMIKNIIVSPNIAIAYAGNNIDGVALLLKKILNKSYSLEDIIEIAYEIHTSSDFDNVEFIIGYYKSDNEKELISIKDGAIIRKCNRVWLGSYDAYKEFKRLEEMIPEKQYKNQFTVCKISNGGIHYEPIDEKLAYEYELERVFKEIVQSNIDDSVGGMTVCMKVPNGGCGFEYMAEVGAYAGFEKQQVQSRENIKFYQGVGKGSYCYNVYQSNRDFVMYIEEDRLGIIYSNEVCYLKGLEGMKYPVLYKNIDEEEFYEIAVKYGVCF